MSPRRPARLAAALLALVLAPAAQALPVRVLPGGIAVPMPRLAAPDTRGPLSFAEGVRWSSDSPAASFGDTRRHNLGENGTWTGLRSPYAALGAAEGTMTIAFDAPVYGVGAVLNHAPPAGLFTIAVHDADMGLLESSTLGISSPCSPGVVCTPGAQLDAGEFHGFARPTADIRYFTLSDAYVTMRELQVSVVPEPPPWLLLLAGGTVLLLLSKRQLR